jgi:uncharacterized protein (DUF1697 family)
MKTYIAFLRGINVGGQKKVKMADLKLLFEGLNFKNALTYIQSGNIVFKSNKTDIKKLEKSIADKIVEQYKFVSEVIIKTPAELKYILNNNPFIKQKKDPQRNYITFLYSQPLKENINKLFEIKNPPEEFIIDGDIVFFFSPNGYGNAKMNNNFFEKKLKLRATTRNWKTVNKLFELSQNV